MKMYWRVADDYPRVVCGANADLIYWVMDKNNKFAREALGCNGSRACFTGDGAEEKLLDMLFYCLSEPSAVAIEKTKQYLRGLWDQWPELGPFPFLDKLVEAQFSSTQIYDKYRDHVVHELKNYITGLMIYQTCTALKAEIDKELPENLIPNVSKEHFFSILWLFTCVSHDVGYIIELIKVNDFLELKYKIKDRYEEYLNTPIKKTAWFHNNTKCFAGTAETNEFECQRYSLLSFDAETFGKIDNQHDYLQKIDNYGVACNLGEIGTAPIFRRYLKLAAKEPNQTEKEPDQKRRPQFHDHGIISAALMLQIWERYFENIQKCFKKKTKTDLITGNLNREFQYSNNSCFPEKLLQMEEYICAAAGAVALHNIEPELWMGQCKEIVDRTHTDYKLFTSLDFKIPLNNKCKLMSLSYLLKFVDELQDWDRPKMDRSEARKEYPHNRDMSIAASDDKIIVHYLDTEEYSSQDRLEKFRKSVSILEPNVFEKFIAEDASPQVWASQEFDGIVLPPILNPDASEKKKPTNTKGLLNMEVAEKIGKFCQINNEGKRILNKLPKKCRQKKQCLLKWTSLYFLAELDKVFTAADKTSQKIQCLKDILNAAKLAQEKYFATDSQNVVIRNDDFYHCLENFIRLHLPIASQGVSLNADNVETATKNMQSFITARSLPTHRVRNYLLLAEKIKIVYSKYLDGTQIIAKCTLVDIIEWTLKWIEHLEMHIMCNRYQGIQYSVKGVFKQCNLNIPHNNFARLLSNKDEFSLPHLLHNNHHLHINEEVS